jgi:hypothetical protein
MRNHGRDSRALVTIEDCLKVCLAPRISALAKYAKHALSEREEFFHLVWQEPGMPLPGAK